MRLLELFSGTKSVGDYAESIGIEVISLDIEPKWNATYTMDILDVNDDFLDKLTEKHGKIDMIWASPDCRHYSKVRYNWRALGHPEPNLEYADTLVRKALYIIDYLKPKFWWIENPATGLLKTRHILDDVPYKRCCYCKYDEDGTFRTKKETMIWGSVNGWDADMCDKAHGYCDIKAEHGRHLESIGNNKNTSVNGTQRLRIPRLLIQSLFDSQGIFSCPVIKSLPPMLMA